MRRVIVTAVAFFFLAPMLSWAGWQVAAPQDAVPDQPFFQAGSEQNDAFSPYANGNAAFPGQFANLGRPAENYVISVSGSIKENLERIMSHYHWRVVWKASSDYNFDGRISGTSLPDVIQKLLKPFPLQAKLYMANKTMIIVPRKM